MRCDKFCRSEGRAERSVVVVAVVEEGGVVVGPADFRKECIALVGGKQRVGSREWWGADGARTLSRSPPMMQ